eukprot:gnl/MRDRNA2_/MRDRNA2_104284_c0_seq1.p1 gnl/MRDRNA2_/MRDRNA2_104284_c0~~gnl/MRDRNA2_/MRDRNA2_104284_c0_seq1.p1  ORF type:complete len:253 (+),score=51.08 gnl/MRDRNA2_/MRDRNA2_104284_c0_seq1:84-842(+)
MPVREDTTEKDALISRVQRQWRALGDAPEHLRADPEVVLMAISNNWAALELAAEPLRSDREFNIAVFRNNGCALQYAVEKLRKDQDVVLAAVREHWAAIQYADVALQNNREIVVQAMIQSAVALKYASPELQAERDQLLLEAGYATGSDPFNEPSSLRASNKGKDGPSIDADSLTYHDIRIVKAKSGSSHGIYVPALYAPPRFKTPVLNGLTPSKDSLSSDGKWHNRRIEEMKERTLAMREAHSRLPLSVPP